MHLIKINEKTFIYKLNEWYYSTSSKKTLYQLVIPKKIVKNSFLKTIQIVQIQMYSDRNMKAEYVLEIFKFKYHDLSIISYCDAPTYLV